MTTPTTETSTGRALRPPRAGRSNGQWALDGRDPLNANEAWKQEDGGLNVRERIEQVYSKEGFASIPPQDLSGRFRWWGLYTQRKPGIDGGRTAQLDDTELSDEYFMLRVRLDGGALTLAQLRVLADLSHEFARGTADISDRQNIQYHWIRVEDVPEVWRRLEAVGLQTTEACGDTPRVILGSPLAGIAADELLDPTPTIDEITRRFIGDPELANLPRKFKSAITGHPSLDVVHEINDISLVGVVHPELGVGYDLWVGGGLSTAPRAGRAARRVRHARAGARRVARRHLDLPRLRLPPAAHQGPPEVPAWPSGAPRSSARCSRASTSATRCPTALPRRLRPAPATTSACTGRRTATSTWAPPRSSAGSAATSLTGLADLMASRRHRPGAPHPAPEARRARRATRCRRRPRRRPRAASAFRCPPAPSAATPWRAPASSSASWPSSRPRRPPPRPIAELERRLADVTDAIDTPVTLNVNGCPNSCARIQVADIGLKGMIVTTDGEQGPGFQVHLGGGLASADRDEAGLGRTVRGLKVTAAELPDLVERLVRRWLDQRGAGETFSSWAHRVDEEELLR